MTWKRKFVANKRKSSRKLALWGCKKLHCSFSSSTPTNDDFFFLLFQNDWLRWHFPPKTSFCRWIWPTTWFSIFRRGPLQTWLEWSVWYWLATKFHASMTMFYQVKLFGIQPFSWHGSYLLSGCLCAPHSLGMLRIATILIPSLLSFRFGKLGGIRLIVELLVLRAYRSTRPTSQPQVPQFGF